MSCTENTRHYLEILFPSASAELVRLGKHYPDGETEEACAAFTKEVGIHRTVLTLAYRNVVSCLKGSVDLDEIVGSWNIYIQYVDAELKTLKELKDRFPYCGTPELYNEFLEYRTAACKRRDQALEEIECLKKIPKGLFP